MSQPNQSGTSYEIRIVFTKFYFYSSFSILSACYFCRGEGKRSKENLEEDPINMDDEDDWDDEFDA